MHRVGTSRNQAALIRPPWILPSGRRWHPSMAGSGNHRAQAKLLEPRPDSAHFLRLDAGFQYRRHEGRKPRGRPAAFLEQFGVDEVEAIERVPLVLDAAVHMRAADLAGVALDRRRRIDDLQLV